MVPGRADPTVHEFPPRDRVERLGGGIATAATGPPDGRENPAAGHEPRASGRRASSPPPTRVEDPDTTDRWTGPARPWPRPRRRARRACDRRSRPRRPLPRETIHDDSRVGESPPGRTMRDAAHPPHPGRGGGDAPAQPARPARKIRRRHDPSRPVPGRPTGNRTRRHHDPADHAEREASTPLRAGPARTRRQPVGPSGPVEEPDNDDGRRVLPPPGRRGPGTAPPGTAAGPGYLHPPAHGPDEAVASSAADAAASHAHPDPRAKKTTAPSGNPFPTRASRSPALSRPIPARPSTVTASAPRPGRSPRHPVTRPPTARATGPYDPATPATGPEPRTIPRTTRPPNPAPHPGTGTTQPHLDHFHPPPEKHQTLQTTPVVLVLDDDGWLLVETRAMWARSAAPRPSPQQRERRVLSPRPGPRGQNPLKGRSQGTGPATVSCTPSRSASRAPQGSRASSRARTSCRR